MWLTLDGPRILEGNERQLFVEAGRYLLREIIQRCEPLRSDAVDLSFLQDTSSDTLLSDDQTGISWFDQWDADQKLWLLDRVFHALLVESTEPPGRYAMLEATIEAVFAVIQIQISTGEDSLNGSVSSLSRWEQYLLNTLAEKHSAPATSDPSKYLAPFIRDQQVCFAAITTHLQITIVGPSCYEQAEQFRDGEPRELERFLYSKGLNNDYLTRIPPVPNHAETLRGLIRLQRLLS